MIPYDIDPSLHTTRPEQDLLDDGFSPPTQDDTADPLHSPSAGACDMILGEISQF